MINKMKRSGIFVLFALSLIFKGSCAWWTAAARGIEPIILSFGAAFAALGLNEQFRHGAQLFNKFSNKEAENDDEDNADWYDADDE